MVGPFHRNRLVDAMWICHLIDAALLHDKSSSQLQPIVCGCIMQILKQHLELRTERSWFLQLNLHVCHGSSEQMQS